MHIPDGILPASVCAAGFVTAGVATWYSIHRLEKAGDPREGIPRASLFTAAFFVGSLVHIPIPPTSVHLILGGLLGVVLGWYALPAILVGLFFQAVLFGHGGITTLGVNATIIGVPALLAYGIFRLRALPGLSGRKATGALAFAGGALGLALSAAAMLALLITTVPASLDAGAERTAIYALTLAHAPLALLEGAVTAFVVMFLLRVKPELLEQSETREAEEPIREPEPVGGR